LHSQLTETGWQANFCYTRKMKRFSEACERNKRAILKKMESFLANFRTVLEIGSGTGQHAVYFASSLPHIQWQTSDLAQNLEGIDSWIKEASLDNLLRPLYLDVDMVEWPLHSVDAVFSANTLHIMSWFSVEKMLRGVSRVLPIDGVLCIYGPFKYQGKYLSERDRLFDLSIKLKYQGAGLRNYDDLLLVAQRFNLMLIEEFEMAFNNRLLIFSKISN